MNQATLLEHAQRCRRLAQGVGDDRAIAALHALADSYQRQAAGTPGGLAARRN